MGGRLSNHSMDVIGSALDTATNNMTKAAQKEFTSKTFRNTPLNTHLHNPDMIPANKGVFANQELSLLRSGISDISKRDVALSGDSTMARLTSSLKSRIQLDGYLLDQKLKNNNTYNRLKSSVAFQNEFLEHLRLNKLT